MLSYLPILSTLVIVPFAYIVLRRWARTRANTAILLWGIGLIFFAIGSFTESLYAIFGWSETWGELSLRIWYLFGAVLVVAWLGQGTVFLLWKRIARPSFVILFIASLYGIYAVFSAPVDSTPLLDDAAELTGKGVLPTSVRLITPFFNIYGVITLVGGALWSAYYYLRRRTEPHRMIGNLLIAAGAMLPGIGGSLNRFGLGLYLGELVGAILLFWGFMVASRRVAAANPAPATSPESVPVESTPAASTT
ncbi:MAG: hypothetical protein QGG58_11635 [Chloroflexota bacterium]|nr:hypothetical protein [Chloroflexota bacterium]